MVIYIFDITNEESIKQFKDNVEKLFDILDVSKSYYQFLFILESIYNYLINFSSLRINHLFKLESGWPKSH